MIFKLQFFGEIQVTRYKDTRYEINLWQQPFYILYLRILYLFDKPKFTFNSISIIIQKQKNTATAHVVRSGIFCAYN